MKTTRTFTAAFLALGLLAAIAIAAPASAGPEWARTDDPDTEQPTEPGNLTATLTSYNTFELTWDASTDNVSVDHYRVYSTFPYSWPYRLAGTTTTPSFIYTAQPAWTSITFGISVGAYDAAGNVRWADLYNVVLPGRPSLPPQSPPPSP
ncbi:hypothetical protein J2S43_007981 [Catenuloplanes nepalensis]|uniref:Fibronectin type-III domain-containing protein n=1 Tax=Catenuloplanes nepalensis TaxID=587533 RepID=A0ABT9N705_9ACTN|nr:hypothetical protein [Catenuloplanes nepalensis]MDP9799469.1 hypothetical protein [Catenuloplanes nepalensis]